MMVLPMDVARDGTADGHEAGPRRHGHEIATRYEQLQQGVEGRAGFDPHAPPEASISSTRSSPVQSRTSPPPHWAASP